MSALQQLHEAFVANEAWIRLGGFAAALVVLLIAERLRPFRGDARPPGGGPFTRRQAVNLGLALIDTALLRLTFPVLAVALAIALQDAGAGLFGRLDWPAWLEFALALLAFDAAIYWQHRLLHTVPWLWPLHRVHHSDPAFDVSTGLRFHPLEIALSMGLKLGLVMLLGPSALAVVVFELWLSVGNLFTHADIALPARVERMARAIVVTPSMHRIHHSTMRDETDSNYGTTLSLWDRLFGSYRAEPRRAPRTMPVGLAVLRDPASQRLLALLLQPVRHHARATRSPELPDA